MGNPNQGNPQLHGDHNNSAWVNKPTWANWATAASTPVHFRDRAGVMSTATDDDQSDHPYTEKQWRKYKRLEREVDSKNSFARKKVINNKQYQKQLNQLNVAGLLSMVVRQTVMLASLQQRN